MITCIGCGCTDDEACEGGCSWVSVNGQLGICTNCVADVPDTVIRSMAEAAAEELAEQIPQESELILPGEDAYYETLRGSR